MEYLEVPFECKAEDVKSDGTFKGYGSTFGGPPDSYRDVVEMGAFAETLIKGGMFGLGVALLYQHRSDEPIGVWTLLQEDKKGLYGEGKLALGVQRAKEAHELLFMKALQGLSIGFRVAEGGSEWDDKKKIRTLKKIDLAEISLVTFPANTRARVTGVKLFEEAKTIRDFEDALREVGLTVSQAKYIASHCRKSFEQIRDGSGMAEILTAIRSLKIT